MIIPAEIERKYKQIENILIFHHQRIKEELSMFCEHYNYSLLTRIKKLDSVAEKIETGRYKNWTDIDDLIACSIIIPTLKHEEKVVEYLKKEYPIDQLILRNTKKKAPDVFRFDTTRYISYVKINDNEKLKFEIQIRSVFEHAWITTTHDLVYKYSSIDWKRLRLAAELKSNIELMDNIILAFEENSDIIKENSWPDVDAKIRINEFISKCFEDKILPVEFVPKDLTRFVDNLFRLIKANPNFNGYNHDQIIKSTSEILLNEFTSIDPKIFPKSISFLQYIFGILYDNQMISFDKKSFIPLITNELKTLFPKTKSLKFKFEIEK